MTKLIPKIVIVSSIICLLYNCNKNKIDYLAQYRKPNDLIVSNIKNNIVNDDLYFNNKANLKNNYPFYVIRLKTPLYLKRPNNNINLPDNYIPLKFGDVVFPVNKRNSDKYFFYVKTIDNKYGWIYYSSGISVNYDEDVDLYFFGKDYYLKRYIESKGDINDSNRIILAKNVVPMLLGNFKANGWFYPLDYHLALDISKLCVDISKDEKIKFHAATSVSYRIIDEIIITYNLLADCYQKLKFYDKSEEIHNFLIKRYFWRESYNSEIGGLTSLVKLEQIYLEQLTDKKIMPKQYQYFKDKIIENFLIVDSNYRFYTWTAKDRAWKGLTFSEWLLDILRTTLKREDFYNFCKSILKKTNSEAVADLINLYMAVEMLREGRNEEEALKVLTTYKPKHNFKPTLKINDWLSENKVVPDSILYQYRF